MPVTTFHQIGLVHDPYFYSEMTSCCIWSNTDTEFVDVERRDSVERDNEDLFPVADDKNPPDDASLADSAGNRARPRTSSGMRSGGGAQRQRRCDWCLRLGPCPTVIDPPPADCCSTPAGGQQGDVGSERNAGGGSNNGVLAFCDEVCLGRYKMNIFCIETQQHLQQMGQQVCGSLFRRRVIRRL